MSLKLIIVTALLAVVNPVAAATQGVEVSAEAPELGTDTVHGCYSSLGDLTLNASYSFNTQGQCAGACRDLDYNVGASRAKACYCGDKYPPLDTLVDDSKCNEPCPGYGTEACGGASSYTVYNTGVFVSVENSPNTTTTSSTAAGTSTTAASSSTSTADTAVDVDVTPSASASASSKSSKGSNDTVGIAVGVVVGVVGAASLAGGIYLCMRRRRNQEIEDEHRRNAAANSFIGGKESNAQDLRLDPVMAQRRVSNGSIADNEDYSRRILRVTNA